MSTSKNLDLKLMVYGSASVKRKKTTLSIPINLMREIDRYCVGNRTGLLDALIEAGLNDCKDLDIPKPNEVGPRQALPVHLSLTLLGRVSQALPGVSIQHATICLLKRGLESIRKNDGVLNIAN